MEEVKKIIDTFDEPKRSKNGLRYIIIPLDAKIFRGDPNEYYTQSSLATGSPGPRTRTYNKETVLGSRGDGR